MSIDGICDQYFAESKLNDHKSVYMLVNSALYVQFKEAMLSRRIAGEDIKASNWVSLEPERDVPFAEQFIEEMLTIIPAIRKELFMEAFSVFTESELRLWREQKELLSNISKMICEIMTRCLALVFARQLNANVDKVNRKMVEEGQRYAGYYGHKYFEGNTLLSICQKTSLW